MLNLDRVTDFLRTQGASAEVRGVTDSGWFLDNVPYAPADCQDPQRCAPTTAVQMGYALWNGQVPHSCKSQYASQPWRCYFGHHLHRTLKSNRLFLVPCSFFLVRFSFQHFHRQSSEFETNQTCLFEQRRCSFFNGFLTKPKCWPTTSVHPCPRSNGITFTQSAMTYAEPSPMSRKLTSTKTNRL